MAEATCGAAGRASSSLAAGGQLGGGGGEPGGGAWVAGVGPAAEFNSGYLATFAKLADWYTTNGGTGSKAIVPEVSFISLLLVS